MKKLLIAILFMAGCATTETKPETATAAMLCMVRTCPDWAKAHNYQLLLSQARGTDCVCTLMSESMPDSFHVTIPNPR